MPRIFVYGTLKEGFYNYEKYLKGHVLSIKKAYVKGTLYSLKGVNYPALISGDEWVHGEIIELEDSFDMRAVDELEGYYGEGCIENEYNKEMMDIFDEKKQVIGKLPVYVYNVGNSKQVGLLDKKIQKNSFILF